MAAKKNLVIVESPAKAKTIGKYLGPDYVVKASMGHLRDLPKSTLGVDVEGDFTPNYRPIKGKEDIIKDLKTTADKSKTVYLATDPDREGEAISWHLQHLLELPDSKAQRVTFNEITKKVVQDSIQHPRAIDQDLVDAQQARRVLDRIVGYQLSPLLWKKIRRGLSAGRVQSVAIRLVAQREKEIADFVPQEYWTLDVHLQNHAAAPFTAHYYGVNGKKYEPKDEADTQRIVEELKQERFAVKTVKRTDKQRSPTPPFTTSSLQQEASRKLNMTPRRTMAIAQQLYEGVDITGEGTVGLITYMRTDSLRISDEAQAQAKELICSRYGDAYYPDAPRKYKTKAGAQDAHEAIRPSDPSLTPEQVKGDLTAEQYRLYRLIWSRFLASQMANAVYDSISVEIGAGAHALRCSASNLKFAGYTAVYEESRDDDKEEKESPLPPLAEGETVTPTGFAPLQHFTQPPARYTDATLIRTMEENGIGRPSTYAPTVSTILDREYVIKEGKYLRLTPLGGVVNELMCQRFPDIVDVKFTARMEQKLDEVESGDKNWKELLGEFYGDFDQFENGVGMCASLQKEFIDALADKREFNETDDKERHVSVATGVLAAPLIETLGKMLKTDFPNTVVDVYTIKNDFFGETITVAGLITAGDIIAQLTPYKDNLGERLLITENMLKTNSDIFLDDKTVSDVEQALGIEIMPVATDGYELLDAIVGEEADI